MGSLVSGCLGSCAGAFCCSILGLGSVASDRAVRCLLLWLQIFALALAVLASATASSWLVRSCEHLPDVGICLCNREADADTCFSTQVIYRVELLAAGQFLLLLLAALTGCHCALRSCGVAKFAVLLIGSAALLCLPKAWLAWVAYAAEGTTLLFLILQAILVIDLSYSWNAVWFAAAHNPCPIIIVAVLLYMASMVSLVCLLTSTGIAVAGIAMAGMAIAFSFVELMVSITDWCEHGSLLTSSAIAIYVAWLAAGAEARQPGFEVAWLTQSLRVGEVVVCLGSLVLLALGITSFSSDEAEQEKGDSEEGCGSSDPSEGSSSSSVSVPSGEWTKLVLELTVHVASCFFVISALAPRPSWFAFALRCGAVLAAQLLYGWSLVAPKILRSRSFA